MSKLHLLAVAVLLAIGLSYISTGCGALGDDPGDPPPDSDTELGKLYISINNARENAGMPALKWDDSLASVAAAYATFCYGKKKYSPTLDGKNPQQRLLEAEISFEVSDETGVCNTSAKTAATAFSSLTASKYNNSAFTRIGIGYKGAKARA
jgi:uncharacterized protein YkwD